MKLIFWGLFFLFFDFNLNFGSSSISVLPEFVGYALILKGMKQVECGAYLTARPWVCAGIIYSAIVWVLNCLGIMAQLTTMAVFAILFAVAGSLLKLGVVYWITKGVCELEESLEYNLYGKSLKTAWIVLLVWIVLVQVTSLLAMAAFALIALIASMIFMIYYLVCFHKSRKAYEERTSWPEEEK